MVRCITCNKVDAISKAGIVRKKQRYFCKSCNVYFSLPDLSSAVSLPSVPVRHPTTINDIAQKLQLSKSTVSRALTGHADINKKTKDEVLQLAKKLNYQPNHLACSLVKKTSNTIGIIVPEFITNFFPTFIIACQEAANAAGYAVMICHSNENSEKERANINMLISNRVDGLIISLAKDTKNLDHLQSFQDSGLPVILFNRVSSNVYFSQVVVNDYDGAFKAVEHLIKNGYKRIAHLAGPKNLDISNNRYKGYIAALKKYNLPVIEELILRHDLSKSGAKACAQKLLNLKPLPDAVFAVNDPAAIEVMMMAKQKKIKIPQQLGVVGFSNDSRSEIIEPGLTTMEQPIVEMGKAAAELFIKQVNRTTDTIATEVIVFDTKLVIRGSSVNASLPSFKTT